MIAVEIPQIRKFDNARNGNAWIVYIKPEISGYLPGELVHDAYYADIFLCLILIECGGR